MRVNIILLATIMLLSLFFFPTYCHLGFQYPCFWCQIFHRESVLNCSGYHIEQCCWVSDLFPTIGLLILTWIVIRGTGTTLCLIRTPPYPGDESNVSIQNTIFPAGYVVLLISLAISISFLLFAHLAGYCDYFYITFVWGCIGFICHGLALFFLLFLSEHEFRRSMSQQAKEKHISIRGRASSRIAFSLCCIASLQIVGIIICLFLGIKPVVLDDYRIVYCSSRNVCANNLRVIDAAKERWAIENNKTSGIPADIAEVNRYLSGNITPVCPQGGHYSYNAIGTEPTCDYKGGIPKMKRISLWHNHRIPADNSHDTIF